MSALEKINKIYSEHDPVTAKQLHDKLNESEKLKWELEQQNKSRCQHTGVETKTNEI